MRPPTSEEIAATAWKILENGKCGVLSTINQDNLLYSLSLTYIVDDGKIYFHLLKNDLKISKLNFSAQVTFVVISHYLVNSVSNITTPPSYVYDFSAYYKSAIITGHLVKIEDDDLKIEIINKLDKRHLDKYVTWQRNFEKSLSEIEVIAIEVDDISSNDTTSRPVRKRKKHSLKEKIIQI